MYRGVFIYLVISLWCVLAAKEGDECTTVDGQTGVCKNMVKCDNALATLVSESRSSPCRSNDTILMVCCVQKQNNAIESYGSPTKQLKRQFTAEILNTISKYKPSKEAVKRVRKREAHCEPINNITAQSTDRIAWKKCLQYQELLYPCQSGFLNESVRDDHCTHLVMPIIYNGVKAAEREFPHMVMLSFNQDIESFTSACGGSLISERFILTAAHCTYRKNVGHVQYAATSVLKREGIPDERIYKIAERLQHPQFDPKYRYYDIALLKTEKNMTLDISTVPACLDVGDDPNDSKALVTGWGSYNFGYPQADHLQKVILEKFSDQECSKFVKRDRKLPNGLNSSIQMCYGHNTDSKDACTGDSGGPVQLKMHRVTCMYSIIAVISHGRGCGTIRRPGVYTKVAPFVDWIEKIVWPDE